MKVHASILLLLFVITFSSVTAQKKSDGINPLSNVKFTVGNPYPVIDSWYKGYYTTKDGIFAIKRIEKGVLNIQRFNSETMNLEDTKKLKLVNPEAFFEVIYNFNDRYFVFYNIYDKSANTEQLFAHEFDIEECKYVAEPIKILTINQKVFSNMGYNKFSFDFSADKSTFAVQYRYYNNAKTPTLAEDKFGLATFNSSMEQLSKLDINLSLENSTTKKLDFTVDAFGNGYFLLKKFNNTGTDSKKSNPDNYSISVIKALTDGSVQESKIELKDYMVEHVVLKENRKKEIFCIGYYRAPKVYPIKGVFVTSLSQNGEVSSPKYYDFPLDLITQYSKVNDKQMEKLEEKDEAGLTGIRDLEMNHVRDLADGGMLFVGQVYYERTIHSKDGTTTIIHYDDVIVTKIEANGELGWMSRIPKRSTSGGYRTIVNDENIYILFVDNIKNATLSTDMKPYSTGRGDKSVIAYKLDMKDGEKEYLPLFNYEKIEEIPVYQFELYRLNVLSETSFFVELYVKKKQDRMFKITLK